MKLSIALVGVFCSTLAFAAPSSPQTGLVAGQDDPPKLQKLGPTQKPQPLKSKCNNECLEKLYFMAGCSHAWDWACLCTEFEDGHWDIDNIIQQCFLNNCHGPEDLNSWNGITKFHCGMEARSQAKVDVWGNLQQKINGIQ